MKIKIYTYYKMSGIQSYYGATQNYAGNLQTAQSYLDNYDSEFYDNWKDKVADLREQGKAYMDLGGAIEGSYVGAKAVKGAYQAWKAKYGKKGDGNEDGDNKGDDENDGDDNDRGGGDDDADLGQEGEEGAEADPSELASQYLGGGVADSGSGGSVALQDMSTPAEAPPAPVQADEEEFGDAQLGEQPGAEGDIRAPAPDQPSPPAGDEPDLSVDVGQGPASQGGASTGAETGVETGVEAGAETGVEAGADATSAVLGAAGVAAEAVPVLGGLVALGIGLYEIFHHHDKPKPPPTPQNTVSQKGEMVVPSFDSVTDTPASQSAF